MYSYSENVFAFGLYGAPSGCDTFQSSVGCRLSRIFWKRLRETCPGLTWLGSAASETKLPTRKACVMTSDSLFEYVGSTTEKFGNA